MEGPVFIAMATAVTFSPQEEGIWNAGPGVLCQVEMSSLARLISIFSSPFRDVTSMLGMLKMLKARCACVFSLLSNSEMRQLQRRCS